MYTIFLIGHRLIHEVGGESGVLGIGLDWKEGNSLAASLVCARRELPISYLGLLLGSNSCSMKFWEPILDEFQKKTCVMEERLSLVVGGKALIRTYNGKPPSFLFADD